MLICSIAKHTPKAFAQISQLSIQPLQRDNELPCKMYFLSLYKVLSSVGKRMHYFCNLLLMFYRFLIKTLNIFNSYVQQKINQHYGKDYCIRVSFKRQINNA